MRCDRLALVCAVFLAGCTPKVPPQPPQPPPLTCPAGQHVEAGVCVPDAPPPPAEEGRPTAPMFLPPVRGEGGRWTRGGAPLDLTGAIPCWPTDGTGEVLRADGKVVPYLWPLTSVEWIDHAKSKGANLVHLRPGPIGAADVCCGLEPYGGPYLPDGSDWNPKWWALFHQVIRHAGAQGFVVEVDGLDGWAVKNSIAGGFHMPFPSADVFTALQLPINPSVRKWIGKLVGETCMYGHVIYQVGNETGVSGVGWTKEWERSMYALIRESEDCGIVHMIGSNGGLDIDSQDSEGPYDYFVSHTAEALSGAFAGRPTAVSEYNPSLSPGQFKSLACAARKAGQRFDYWRSDGSDARQDESLALLKAGCDAPAMCPTPQPPREKLAFTINCVREICDVTPIVTKALDYCTSIGMGTSPDGVTPRAACPMRNECPGFDCENRLSCEQYAMSVPGVCNAVAPTFHSDGTVEAMDQWGFRVRVNGSWIEACACDGSHCTRKEL